MRIIVIVLPESCFRKSTALSQRLTIYHTGEGREIQGGVNDHIYLTPYNIVRDFSIHSHAFTRHAPQLLRKEYGRQPNSSLSR